MVRAGLFFAVDCVVRKIKSVPVEIVNENQLIIAV